MNKLKSFYQSSLGKKYIMALTGFALFIFVIVHMVGNLQIFLGAEPINAYGAFLKSRPGLLWSARIGLLVLAVAHITAAITLALQNRAARPIGYEDKKVLASFASQTIVFSGLIIFAFIVYHLLHFTFGSVNPELVEYRDATGRHDVHRMMVAGFSNVGASIFYIVSMGLLCLHLSHGVGSMFQSLGLRRKAYVRGIERFANTAAVVIFAGNSAIPIAILAGLVK